MRGPRGGIPTPPLVSLAINMHAAIYTAASMCMCDTASAGSTTDAHACAGADASIPWRQAFAGGR